MNLCGLIYSFFYEIEIEKLLCKMHLWIKVKYLTFPTGALAWMRLMVSFRLCLDSIFNSMIWWINLTRMSVAAQPEFILKWKTHVNKRDQHKHKDRQRKFQHLPLPSNKLCLNGNDVQNKLHLNNKLLFAVIVHHYDWVAFALCVCVPNKFSGCEIVNTIHGSNKRREINEKLGDIRCRDQFFITCFSGECFFLLSLFVLLHRFLSNVCWNMLRYVNYTRVIYKRLFAQTQNTTWKTRTQAGKIKQREHKLGHGKKYADTACMINTWQCWRTNCSKYPNKSMAHQLLTPVYVQKPFSDLLFFKITNEEVILIDMNGTQLKPLWFSVKLYIIPISPLNNLIWTFFDLFNYWSITKLKGIDHSLSFLIWQPHKFSVFRIALFHLSFALIAIQFWFVNANCTFFTNATTFDIASEFHFAVHFFRQYLTKYWI